MHGTMFIQYKLPDTSGKKIITMSKKVYN